uniref:Uncharacterized protein n=1 Tax=Amphilophus citrinellus TaxID=61819 RepID=A0A3Q0SLK0_AMPCI
MREKERETIVAAHRIGKGYKVISKSSSFYRMIIYKWKTLKTDASLSGSGCPSKFTPRSDCAVLRETAQTPRATSQTLQNLSKFKTW